MMGKVNECTVTSNLLSLMSSFNPFPNKPWFLRVFRRNLLKTRGGGGGDEKLLVTSNFFLSPQCFLPIWEISAISIKFKIQESMDNVSCRRDMTEILLKAALNTIQSINQV